MICGSAGITATRHDDRLRFDDPEGLGLELVATTSSDTPLTARHPDVPSEFALQGFASVHAYGGRVAATSAFVLYTGVRLLESFVFTPIIQRQALNIPAATLFAVQILLGAVFGIWGLALALPLMAIAKVMIDYFKADEPQAATA